MTKQLKVSGSTLRSRSPEDKGKIVNQVIEHIWPLIVESFNDAYTLVNGTVEATGAQFNDAYRYVDWLLTASITS
jgi:hypothetical protein